MSTIRSTLIKTCINNVQKELGQLEHWLHILPDEVNMQNINTTNVNNYNNQYTSDIHSIKMSISNISNNINTLIDTTNRQQMLIDSINARLQHIENIRTIRVDDPWTDNHIVPLQNEIVNLCVANSTCNDGNSDNESECVYCVNKQEDECNDSNDTGSENVASVHPLIKTPELQPNIPDDMSDVPDINDDNDFNLNSSIIETKYTEEIVTNTNKETKDNVEVEENQEENVIIEDKNNIIQPNDNVKCHEQEEEEEQEGQEEQEEQEEEEQEEEEEGLELEEIEFKGTKYYKDGEGFIYSINDDEEPSENPIGYWKEKTQSIAFYKLK